MVLATIFLVASPVLAQSQQNCAQEATYLQILYKFSWSQSQQQSFSNRFDSHCITKSYLASLTDEVAASMRAQDIDVEQITILPEQGDGIISFRVTTKGDSASGNELAVLLPLRERAKGQVITALEIIGIAQEGNELIARYAVNEAAYQSGSGKLQLQWLRDGVPIKGAIKSRYQLQKDDVGAQISAILRYGGDDIALSDERSAIVKAQILAANYPPSIENLAIIGEALTGSELTASYDFIDENEADSEGQTSYIWLRDNIAIPNATGRSYELGAVDIGAQISVRVEPQSQDGQKGEARTVTLSDIVRPNTIIANRDVIDNIISDDANNALDSTDIADAITKETAAKDIGVQDTGAQEEVTVTIAVPKQRPDVPEREAVKDPVAAQDTKDKLDDTAAIIIEELSEDEVGDDVTKDAPILLSDEDKPPVILTPGFEIAANGARNFTKIAFSPSAILLESELAATQKAVLGTPITLEAIKIVLDEVNALYLSKGFELSRALLPEQTVTDGVVSIQLVEASIGKIILENREDLSEEFILAHLAAQEGDFISLKALERSIRTYNLSNKSKLATELAPGEEFGQTDIFVDVAEPDKVELPSVSINNYANQTSDWRQNAVSITMNNLIGRDDETALSYSDSKGSTSMSGSVSMPVNHRGTNVSLALSSSDTKIVAGSEETVGYRGSASSFGATVSHPLYFGDDYSFYLSGNYGVAKSDLVQPVTGAMLSKSEVRKYSMAVPFSYNNGTTAVSLSPSWHILNIVTEIPKREKWMQKFDLNANASHFLSDKWTLNGRGKFLYSDARDMINMPSEILSVGGPSSVRAYQPGESSGYQGYFLSGELRTDLAKWEQVQLPDFMPSAQTYIFLDHMMAQSQYKVRSRADYWSGYGIGLQIPSIFNLLTFNVYWSEPLDGSVHEEEKEFYDDEMFQFSLSARFRLQ